MGEVYGDPETRAMLRLLTSACVLLALDAGRNNKWLRSGVDWRNFKDHLESLDEVRLIRGEPEDRGLDE